MGMDICPTCPSHLQCQGVYIYKPSVNLQTAAVRVYLPGSYSKYAAREVFASVGNFCALGTGEELVCCFPDCDMH